MNNLDKNLKSLKFLKLLLRYVGTDFFSLFRAFVL